MKAPTPLEVCIQIAGEHAASTTAAIVEKRAARLAAGLEDYTEAVSELAGENRDEPVEESP